MKDKLGRFVKGSIPWNKGKKMSKEFRQKLSETHKGIKYPNRKKPKPFTKEHIQNVIDGRKGYKHSDESKLKMSESRKLFYKNNPTVKMPSMKGKKHSEESKEKNRLSKIKLYKEHPEIIDKIRYNTIKHFKKYGYADKFGPNVGKYEKRALDILEESFGYEIKRQHQIDTFFVDGYCPMLNLVIEIDEPFHKNRIKYDKFREHYIKDKLGCQFLRIEVPT